MSGISADEMWWIDWPRDWKLLSS